MNVLSISHKSNFKPAIILCIKVFRTPILWTNLRICVSVQNVREFISRLNLINFHHLFFMIVNQHAGYVHLVFTGEIWKFIDLRYSHWNRKKTYSIYLLDYLLIDSLNSLIEENKQKVWLGYTYHRHDITSSPHSHR